WQSASRSSSSDIPHFSIALFLRRRFPLWRVPRRDRSRRGCGKKGSRRLEAQASSKAQDPGVLQLLGLSRDRSGRARVCARANLLLEQRVAVERVEDVGRERQVRLLEQGNDFLRPQVELEQARISAAVRLADEHLLGAEPVMRVLADIE